MRTYPKIDTLFNRDKETFKVIGEFRKPEFASIDRWVVTEKIDGTNIRIDFRYDDTRGKPGTLWSEIGGRTDKAEIPQPLFEVLATIAHEIEPEVEKILDEFGITSYTLFGEGYGAKIQKGGGNYRSDQGFILFDVLVNDRTWLSAKNTKDAAKRLGLDCVPFLGYATLQEIVDLVQPGFTSTVAETPHPAEGIIAQPLVPLYDSRGERVMFKLKTKDFG